MSEIPGQSGHALPNLKLPLCAIERHLDGSNGIDALTTDHDPVKLFRWNKPTKQRGLIDEIVFIAPRKNNETDA